MVDEKNYIEDTKLPVELDFKALKEEGLAYIQKHSGNQWTNLNPSDPGVTILDQLCYAFTELGYCTNFPIKDILTNNRGVLEIENQFYLPEDILTTSPITKDDYYKYIIDRIPDALNCDIQVVTSNVYQIYVHAYKSFNTSGDICKEVLNEVNKVRNLGAYFLTPKLLIPLKYNISGSIEIEEGYNLDVIITNINYKINNYIFPRILQTGYDRLEAEGYSINEIFNGPKLKRGWTHNIQSDSKKNTIEAFEIQKEIQNVSGVVAVSDICFIAKGETDMLYVVRSGIDQIIELDLINSIGSKGLFKIIKKGKIVDSISNNDHIKSMTPAKLHGTQLEAVEAIQLTPKIPVGKYRDISNYYSIQNTFPEIYAVGLNSLDLGASSFQISQSRQLKGYLTLFDQVLSNQFAQLANIGTLFSFKNPMTGAPSDEKHFYEIKNEYQKKNSRYPAPYKNFSSTYFYQSLYDTVPHIRPLLKNNDTYKYSFEAKSEKELLEDSWIAYKNDPYNAYMHGLMSFMEDEDVNLERRNTILDHLLARHGESPAVIDNVISVHQYTANPKKNQVIIKSLLLQNYGTLSYYRCKAYNYSGATRLNAKLKPVTDAYINQLLNGNQTDFIFDTERIDTEQYITPVDYQNYPTIVLKINLLFVINGYYHNYLIDNRVDEEDKEKVQDNESALWLLDNRKGFFFIETDLLKKSFQYSIVLKKIAFSTKFILIKKMMNYQEVLIVNEVLQNTNNKDFDTIKKDFREVLGKDLQFEVSESSTVPEDYFTPSSNTMYEWAVFTHLNDEITIEINDPLFSNTVVSIFPDIFQDEQDEKLPIEDVNANHTRREKTHFEERLDFFLAQELPIHLTPKNFFTCLKTIQLLIPLYVIWYNSLVHFPEHPKNGVTKIDPQVVLENVNKLAIEIIKLNELND